MATTEARPGETVYYRLRQHLNAAVRQLRDAEDIARMEMPATMPTADRIRSIYEQISEDVLNGKTNRPPLLQQLRESEARCSRLAAALMDDHGVSTAEINAMWEPA
jgi:hypothetical protein